MTFKKIKNGEIVIVKHGNEYGRPSSFGDFPMKVRVLGDYEGEFIFSGIALTHPEYTINFAYSSHEIVSVETLMRKRINKKARFVGERVYQE